MKNKPTEMTGYRIVILNNVDGEEKIEGYIGSEADNKVTLGTSIYMSRPFKTKKDGMEYLDEILRGNKEFVTQKPCPVSRWKDFNGLLIGGRFLKVVECGKCR